MTGVSKVYVDTAPLICLLDGSHIFHPAASSVFKNLISGHCRFATSVLTWMEYMSAPDGPKPEFLLPTLQCFCAELGFSVYNINTAVALKAAKIRRQYPGFKSMDSLHLACACVFGCDSFLTADRQLSAFRELNVIQIRNGSPCPDPADMPDG